MSQVVWPISKLPLTKKPVFSCFSTATTSRSKPYLLFGTKIKENALNFNLYDPTGNKEVVKNLKFEDQSENLRNLFQESRPIGSSRGHLALRNRKDSSVHLVDISNDQLKPKIISLPPLNIDNGEKHVNVSVSSPINGDVIVAVKFCGSRLSLCRAGDSEWTRVDVPCPSFHFSTVMYSERDERFYLNNWNLNYTGPFDFTPKSGLVTPVSVYLKFPIGNIRKLNKDSYHFRRNHMADFDKDSSGDKVEQQLVESPSGQSFIVYRFIDCFNEKGEPLWGDGNPENEDITEVTEEIIVFKQDEEQEIGPYTNDIGDLCIFIGQNEAFCVSVNDYPGLKPNSVYFAGHGSDFGLCDLSSQTICRFSAKSTPKPYGPMFWIPPSLIS